MDEVCNFAFNIITFNKYLLNKWINCFFIQTFLSLIIL